MCKTVKSIVEGPSDESYLNDAISIYYPILKKDVLVKHSSKTGASGVVRNVLVWAFSLSKNEEGDYIKSVGLFDGDKKGYESVQEIKKRIINPDSAESKTFKTFTLSVQYAPHLLDLYRVGIKIPITIEELFMYEQWKFAQDNNWLEFRQDLDQYISNTSRWNKMEMSLKNYIDSLDLSPNVSIYLNKVRDANKEDFKNYIESLKGGSKSKALSNFKILLDDILKYLGKTIAI